ncbi:MAG: inositol monophosphatase family protein [Ignavibacteriaceae bacterium]
MIEDLKYIAIQAGELIRAGFGKNFGIDFKSNASNLVTEIDKSSEKLITSFIRKKYPDHGILAEEGGTIMGKSEFLWVVDPLDGTTNFAHGLPIFSVSIGLQKSGNTIAGVVYDVMQDILYAAEAGSGSFAGNKRLRVSSTNELNRALLVTGFPYNINENPENAFEKFVALTKASRGMRRLGSAAIDFCYVASGVFDGFWEVFLNPWDLCAGKLIVEEAGGKVSDFDETATDIYSKRILSSNGLIHNQMSKILMEN